MNETSSSMLYIPDDVLWYIFSQNVPQVSSMRSERCFDFWPVHGCMSAANSTSQVCRRWRQVMLSSSNIWSKVIDFYCLDKYKLPVHWLSEVVGKRCKGQKLHVYGSISRGDGLWAFLELIRACWQRIEVLDISISIWKAEESLLDHSGWTTMAAKVSPALEYFNLDGHELLRASRDTPYIYPNARNPKIRYLRATGFTQLPDQPGAPIYQNLCVLSIQNAIYDDYHDRDDEDAYKIFPWTIKQVFGVLEGTPCLEILTIEERVLLPFARPLIFTTLPPIHLPSLRKLAVDGDISVCLAMLLHIQVQAPQCALSMGIQINDDLSLPAEWIDILQQILLKQFASQTIFCNHLSLGISKHYPGLHSTPSSDNRLSLQFSIPDDPPRRSHFPMLDFLANKAFDLSQVPSLELDMNHKDLEHVNPFTLHAVLRKFENVTCLKSNWEIFHLFLDKLSTNPFDVDGPGTQSSAFSSLLPRLTVLKFYEYDRCFDGEYQPALTAIFEFCKIYRMRGRDGCSRFSSLERLDLSQMGIDDELSFILPLLDELDGLEVVFLDRNRRPEGRMEVAGSGRLAAIKVDTDRTTRKRSSIFVPSDDE